LGPQPTRLHVCCVRLPRTSRLRPRVVNGRFLPCEHGRIKCHRGRVYAALFSCIAWSSGTLSCVVTQEHQGIGEQVELGARVSLPSICEQTCKHTSTIMSNVGQVVKQRMGSRAVVACLARFCGCLFLHRDRPTSLRARAHPGILQDDVLCEARDHHKIDYDEGKKYCQYLSCCWKCLAGSQPSQDTPTRRAIDSHQQSRTATQERHRSFNRRVSTARERSMGRRT